MLVAAANFGDDVNDLPAVASFLFSLISFLSVSFNHSVNLVCAFYYNHNTRRLSSVSFYTLNIKYSHLQATYCRLIDGLFVP